MANNSVTVTDPPVVKPADPSVNPPVTAPDRAPAPTNGATPVAAPAAPPTQPTTKPPRSGGGGRVFAVLVGLVVLVVAGYFGVNYFLDNQRYVSTDDALVDSNLVSIASPAGGTLVNWQLHIGDTVRAGSVIGTVRVGPTGGASPLIDIKAPQDGTVLKVDGKDGQVIGQAQAIAYMADLSNLHITAYIDEGDVHRVQVGQSAQVTVDGTGSQVYEGTVAEVIPATASQFALIQTQDRGSGNFTKVTQRVEVHIDIGDTSDSQLYPGMNAHVKIVAVGG